MLPASYGLAWWAVAVKWLSAAVLAWYGGVMIAIGALFVIYICSLFVPVPHGYFVPAFKRTLQARGANGAHTPADALLEAVRNFQLHFDA